MCVILCHGTWPFRAFHMRVDPGKREIGAQGTECQGLNRLNIEIKYFLNDISSMQIINTIFFLILYTYTFNFLLYCFRDVISTLKHKYLILTYTETKQE